MPKKLTTGTEGGESAVPALAKPNMPAFFDGDSEQLEGFKQISLPPIVKPREMPDGAWFAARITGIMPSPIKEYKNRILQLTRLATDGTYSEDGFRFCFPLTAVVSKALGATDEDQDKQIGNDLLLKKTGTKTSKKGKKDMNMFSVFLRPAGKKK